jgi:hypothetical protein
MTIGLHRLHTSFAVLVILKALLRCFVNGALASDDLLDGGEDGAPVFEDGERHVFACAVGDEVLWLLVWRGVACVGRVSLTVAFLGEEEVGLTGGGKVGDSIAGVEESRALVGGELGVGAESEGLVVAKVAAVVLARDCNYVLATETTHLSSLLINRLVATGHGLVADNVNLVAVWSNELLQNTANHRCHAGGDDDSRDVVCQRPLEVLVEVRVESDVLDEVVDALGEGAGDGVHHLAECNSVEELLSKYSRATHLMCRCSMVARRYLPEGLLALEHIFVASPTLVAAVADGVCLS